MTGALRLNIVISLMLGLTGCASRSLNTELTTCVYPDSYKAAAPAFICDKSTLGYPVSELRTVPRSEGSVSERTQAIFKDQIEVWSNLWSATWFSDPNEQALAKDYLLTLLADEARVVRSRFSPKGQLWLLIAIDKSLTQIELLTRNNI